MSTEPIPMLDRDGKESSSGAKCPQARYLRFGAFQLDLQREELFKNGSRLKLQGKAYQVLRALLEKPGEVVTREDLRMRLWPLDAHVHFDANVNTTVNKLRRVLGDSPNQPAYIETFPRKGYSFLASVEFTDQPVAVRPPGAPAHAAALPPFAENRADAGSWPFLRSQPSPGRVMAGMVTLLIAGMLLGAGIAILWISHFGRPAAWH